MTARASRQQSAVWVDEIVARSILVTGEHYSRTYAIAVRSDWYRRDAEVQHETGSLDAWEHLARTWDRTVLDYCGHSGAA